ncbi:MAG: hypothetical protein ACLVJ6_12405 [Merdibacter sp.]
MAAQREVSIAAGHGCLPPALIVEGHPETFLEVSVFMEKNSFQTAQPFMRGAMYFLYVVNLDDLWLAHGVEFLDKAIREGNGFENLTAGEVCAAVIYIEPNR